MALLPPPTEGTETDSQFHAEEQHEEILNDDNRLGASCRQGVQLLRCFHGKAIVIAITPIRWDLGALFYYGQW